METTASALSKEQAIARAAQLLGAAKYDKTKVTGEIITLTDRCMAFLHGNLKGKKTWRIEFPDVQLETMMGSRKIANANVRRWRVILSPDSGHILSATSVWPEREKRMAAYPPIDSEESQMSAVGKQYSGLPKDAPKVTLTQALSKSMGWSEQARQVSAQYVLESSVKYKERAVWIVHVRGFQPMSPPVPEGAKASDIPVEARNHLRNVIDAQTGEWLGSSSVPQPLKEPPKDLPALEDRY